MLGESLANWRQAAVLVLMNAALANEKKRRRKVRRLRENAMFTQRILRNPLGAEEHLGTSSGDNVRRGRSGAGALNVLIRPGDIGRALQLRCAIAVDRVTEIDFGHAIGSDNA